MKQYVPCDPQSQAEAKLAELLQLYTQLQRLGLPNSEIPMNEVAAILRDWHTQEILPRVKIAVTDDASYPKAISKYLNWWRTAQLLGASELFRAESDKDELLLAKGMPDA
jgi:hypothetical protein